MYIKKGSQQKKKKQNLFPCCSPNVLEMKLGFYAHEKMKQTNMGLFIGNNNKDRKKKNKSMYILQKNN